MGRRRWPHAALGRPHLECDGRPGRPAGREGRARSRRPGDGTRARHVDRQVRGARPYREQLAADRQPDTAAAHSGAFMRCLAADQRLDTADNEDIWVAGDTSNNRFTYTGACPYAARWNGSTWTTYAPPNRTGDAERFLGAMTYRTDGTVWAVGTGHESEPQFGFDFYDGFPFIKTVLPGGAYPFRLLRRQFRGHRRHRLQRLGRRDRRPGPDPVQLCTSTAGPATAGPPKRLRPYLLPPRTAFPSPTLRRVGRGRHRGFGRLLPAPHRLNPLIDIRDDN